MVSSPDIPMDRRCSQGMAAILSADARGTYDAMDDVIYALHSDFSVGYLNPAWYRNCPDANFQQHWGLGSDTRKAWPTLMAPAMTVLLRSLMQGAGGTRPIALDYACPTPARHRQFTMWLHPLPDAVLVVNVQVRTRDGGGGLDPDRNRYTHSTGKIHQCLNCRRTWHPYHNRWDWIPAWVEQRPEAAASDLCSPCQRSYLRRLNTLADNPAGSGDRSG